MGFKVNGTPKPNRDVNVESGRLVFDIVASLRRLFGLDFVDCPHQVNHTVVQLLVLSAKQLNFRGCQGVFSRLDWLGCRGLDCC